MYIKPYICYFEQIKYIEFFSGIFSDNNIYNVGNKIEEQKQSLAEHDIYRIIMRAELLRHRCFLSLLLQINCIILLCWIIRIKRFLMENYCSEGGRPKR